MPTYVPNTNAWVGWSQFNKPQNNSIPPTQMPDSQYPMLVENLPTWSGGYHWNFAPSSERFFYGHNNMMNLLYFDGHVGPIRSAQQIVLYIGDAP